MFKIASFKEILSNKLIKIPLIVLIIAGVGFGGYKIYNNMMTAKANKTAPTESKVTVARGDIEVIISGSGSVAPISRYDIIPLIKGNILNAPFEEGMQVKAGDLLYQIDDSDLSINLQKTTNSIEKLKIDNQATVDSLRNLMIYSPSDGKITGLTLKEGDQAGGNNARIAEIINDEQLTAILAFTKTQLEKIYIGQKAQLIIPKFMTYIDGKVTYISNTTRVSGDGSALYDVEITVKNPGSIVSGLQVNGLVQGTDGDIISPVTGIIENFQQKPVISSTSGTVKKLFVKNNEWVKKGQMIVQLENDSLTRTNAKDAMALKDLELSLKAQLKVLNDYNIVSPIDGIIIKKNLKAGDTVNNANNSNSVLMTVADMTKMTFSINVDELDIAKVQLAQNVKVTADSLPEAQLEGIITNIQLEGQSQNGVTIYPVEVTIDNPGELRAGMNVNAEIIVESKKNVLYLPLTAVTKVANRAFVFVADTGTKTTDVSDSEEGRISPRSGSGEERQTRQNNGESRRPNPIEGQDMRSNWQQNSQEGDRNNRQNTTGANGERASRMSSMPNMEGKQRREVVVGINNDTNIEIVSGLKEGETVFIPSVSSSNRTTQTNVAPNFMGGSGMGLPTGGTRVPTNRTPGNR